jgi:hypothetical protein
MRNGRRLDLPLGTPMLDHSIVLLLSFLCLYGHRLRICHQHFPAVCHHHPAGSRRRLGRHIRYACRTSTPATAGKHDSPSNISLSHLPLLPSPIFPPLSLNHSFTPFLPLSGLSLFLLFFLLSFPFQLFNIHNPPGTISMYSLPWSLCMS